MTWNRLAQIIITACLAAVLGWMSLSTGCNKQLIGSLGGEQNLPTTPGATDYVMIRYYNAATLQGGAAGIGFSSMSRFAGGASFVFGGVGDSGLVHGEDFGALIPCNVTVVTLGDVDDPTVPGAWVCYHPVLDPVHLPLKPFGKILQNGIDFRCGDTITFVSINDSTAKEGYSLTYNVLSGQDAPTTFTGPDVFALFQKEVADFNALISQGLFPVDF
jgi:hypothetical protein